MCNIILIKKKLFCILIYFKIPVIKAEFSASLLQSSVSLISEGSFLICWFAAQETFLINHFLLLNTFWGNHDTLFHVSLINRKFKITVFIWNLFEMICNIINVFTITFEQLNASLLNKSNNFYQKILTDLKLWNISVHTHILTHATCVRQYRGANPGKSREHSTVIIMDKL